MPAEFFFFGANEVFHVEYFENIVFGLFKKLQMMSLSLNRNSLDSNLKKKFINYIIILNIFRYYACVVRPCGFVGGGRNDSFSYFNPLSEQHSVGLNLN